MFPYKFAPHSQKPDMNIISGAFSNPLKRSNPDMTHKTAIAEATTKRVFDGGFPQSLSSRDVEPRTHCPSSYQHRTPEIVESKPPASLTRTSSRLGPDQIEIGLNSRAFTSSTDYRKRFVKEETQEPDLSRDIEPEDVLDAATARFRSMKQELRQQREYAADLESRLAAKNEENARLLRDFSRMETTQKQVMDKHRDALGKAAKNYSTLKSELDDFKRSSEASSLIILEAKATVESLAALRDSTQNSLRDLESMFDHDGRLILTVETRETVHELRCELSKTQQVADLLRDKLHSMGTDLAESRARILELEELTTADKNRSESTTLKIHQSADQIMEVTRYFRELKHESLQAAAKVCEMEQQLVHAQSRLQEAQSMISSMKEEMTAREELQEEQGSKLRTLRHTIDFQEGNVKGLEARARKAEEQLVQALNHNHELQGRLDSAKSLEKNLAQQASRLLSEQDGTKEKLHAVERQLAEVCAREQSLSSELAKALIERNTLADKLKSLDNVQRDANMYRERYSGCQVSLKVLQERFDDQCVALAASKESISELQERLHIVERQATEASIESKHELIHLQEQNGALKAGLDRTEKEIEHKAAALQALRDEFSRKEGAFQASLEIERLGKTEALDQVQEAKTKVKSLLSQLAQENFRIQEMAKRLAAAEAPCADREREVTTLRVRIAELEATEKRLADRAATIYHRYENNDLNDDEKALVALLMQKARLIHDREMVEKTNEIKRRDAIIKQHEARIVQLENLLTRRICDESEWSASTKGTGEQGNLMAVNATQPQVPSPDHQPEIRGAGHEESSTTAAHDATDGVPVNPIRAPGPSSRSTGHSKLWREDTDDIANFEDENPPVATGKRVMFAEAEDESSRPARRAKHGKGTGVEKLGTDQVWISPSHAVELEKLFTQGTMAPTSGTGTGTGNKKKTTAKRR